MAISFLVALVASFAAVLLHYELLRLLHSAVDRLTMPPRPRIVVIIAGALLAHVLEIALFAVAIWLLALDHVLGLATSGSIALDQALFVSFESYSALGGASAYPAEPLRLFAGMESLTGLVLIGWTTAFTYMAMNRLWDQH